MHVKETSYISGESIIRTKILPFLGDLKLTDLTPVVLRNWQNEIVKLGLKPGSLREVNRKCSALLNYAVRFFGLKENPLRKAGSIGGVGQSQNFWQIDEYKKFVACVRKERHKVIFNLLFYSGMRIGELLALDVDDFDFEKNLIHITKNRPTATRKITTPKTPGSVRDVEMPPSIMREVEEYLKRLDEVSSPVFDLSLQPITAALRRGAKKANLPIIRIHDLRHSHASFLITHGVPITAISKRLGHKNPSTTLNIYSHFYKDSGAQIAALLQDNLI